MRDKYYRGNTCYHMSNRKRKRILKRRIRSACNIIIGICLFTAVGIIGSVDVGEISLAEFFIHETINTCMLLASIWVRVNV